MLVIGIDVLVLFLYGLLLTAIAHIAKLMFRYDNTMSTELVVFVTALAMIVGYTAMVSIFETIWGAFGW